MNADLSEDEETVCYLRMPDRGVFLPVTRDAKDRLLGSYIVWDTRLSQWVRSGKAIRINKLCIKHDNDAFEDTDSTFYLHHRCRWVTLTWYVSLGLEDDAQVLAACSMMTISTRVHKKLDKATWSGANKSGKEREPEMMSYLAELCDDLLMAPSETWSSEAPGFEGPLGVKIPDK